MKCWKTKSGYEIFPVLSGRSNSYLISTETYNILVDTGVESNYNNLNSVINSLIIPGKKISFLILTHTHFDHCQNAAKIKEEQDCKIIIGRNGNKSSAEGFTKLPMGTLLLTKPITILGNLIGKRKFGYPPFRADIFIDDQFDFTEFRMKIKLICTPGHCSDSVSVLVDDEIAIVGDTMFGIFKNSILPPFADNPAELMESWQKLLNTSCNIFLPGHGREISRTILQNGLDHYKGRFW